METASTSMSTAVVSHTSSSSAAGPALFDISPPLVRFSSSTPHVPISTVLSITNRSPHPQYVTVTAPCSHLFSLSHSSSPPPSASKLATGMSVSYTLTFTPSQAVSLDDRLLVRGGGGGGEQTVQLVRIQCRVGQSSVVVRGGEAGARAVIGGGSAAILLMAENTSAWPVLVSLSSSSPAFCPLVHHLALAVAESRQVVLRYQPQHSGREDAQLQLLVTRSDTEEAAAFFSHPVWGEGEDLTGQLQLSASTLRMANTFMSLSSQQTVSLSNASQHAVSWQAQLASAAPSPFQLIPESGTLFPGATCDVTLLFSPPSSSAFSSTFSLSALGLATPLSLQLSGAGVGPSLSFLPSSHLDLGVLEMGRAVQFRIRLSNEGMIEAGWQWGVGDEQKEAWTADVTEGRIGVRRDIREQQRRERRKIRIIAQSDDGDGDGEEEDEREAEDESRQLASYVDVNLSFLPQHVGQLLTQLPFRILHSSPLLLTVKASVVGPALSLSQRRLELGDVAVGTRREEAIRIRNDSSITASMSMRLRGAEGDVKLSIRRDEQTAQQQDTDAMQEADTLQSVQLRGGAELELLVAYCPLRASLQDGQRVEQRHDLEVDVDGVGVALFVVPILATAITPSFRLSPRILSLPSAFIHHPSQAVASLHNDNAIAMRVEVEVGDEAADDSVQLSSSSLLLPPRSSTALTVTVTPRSLAARTLSVRVFSCGSTSLSSSLVLSYTASGPVVSLSPASLSFPGQACLSSSSLPVTLSNSSPIPASISPFFHQRNCPFSLSSLTPFVLQPHASTTLTVTASPLEPSSRIAASLSFLLDNAEPLTLPLSSSAFGSSIHSSIPFTPAYAAAAAAALTPAFSFSHQPTCTRVSVPFSVDNRGSQRQRLTWEHIPTLPDSAILDSRRSADRNAAITEEERRKASFDAAMRAKRQHKTAQPALTAAASSVFSIEPASVLLDGLQGFSFVLSARCDAAGAVQERWICSSLTDGARKPELIFDSLLHADFHTPTVAFSRPELCFIHTVQPAQQDAAEQSLQLQQTVDITNTTQLPLSFTLSTDAWHLSVTPTSVDKLPPGQQVQAMLTFAPVLSAYELHSTTSRHQLRIDFAHHHPSSRLSLPVTARVVFANLSQFPHELDFGCVGSSVSKRLTRLLKNDGDLPVDFQWTFSSQPLSCSSQERDRQAETAEQASVRLEAERGVFASIASNDLFDISPIRGQIPPQSESVVELIFHAPALPSLYSSLAFSTALTCRVMGGPDYAMNLTAACSHLSYQLSHDSLTFPMQSLNTAATESVCLSNTGTLPFAFTAHLAEDEISGEFSLRGQSSPSLGAGEQVKLAVTYHAKYPRQCQTTLRVQIEYLPRVMVTVTAQAVYPSLHISLPRRYDDEAINSQYQHFLSQFTANPRVIAEMEAERLLLDYVLHTAANISMVSELMTARYELPFPPSRVGEEQTVAVTLTNRSAFDIATVMSTLPAALSSSPFTLSPLPIPAIASGQSVTVRVKNRSALPGKANKPALPPAAHTGRHSIALPFAPSSPSCTFSLASLLTVAADVFLPSVSLSATHLSLGPVRLGQRREAYLQLSNSRPVTARWTAGIAGGSSSMRIWPDTGLLEQGETVNVAVLFEPRPDDEGRTKWKLTVRVVGGAELLTAAVTATVHVPTFTVSPSSLSLPPLQPHSASSPLPFTLSNLTAFPMELFSPVFTPTKLTASIATLSSLCRPSSSTLLVDPLTPAAPLPAIVQQRLREMRDGFTSALPVHTGVEVLSAASLPASSLSPTILNVVLLRAGEEQREEEDGGLVDGLRRCLGIEKEDVLRGVDVVIDWYAAVADAKRHEADMAKTADEERERRLKELQKRKEKAKGKKEEEEKIQQEEMSLLSSSAAPASAYSAQQLLLSSRLQEALSLSPPCVSAALLEDLLQEYLLSARGERCLTRSLLLTSVWSRWLSAGDVAAALLAVMGRIGGERENRLYAVVLDGRKEDWEARLQQRREERRAREMKEKEDDKTAADKAGKKKPAAPAAAAAAAPAAASSAVTEEELERDRARSAEWYAPLPVAALFGHEADVEAVWARDMPEEERAWRDAERMRREEEEEQRKQEEKRKAEEAKAATSAKLPASKRVSVVAIPPSPSPSALTASIPSLFSLTPPAVLTSSPSSPSRFAFVKFRRFDASASLQRLQEGVRLFVKEEPFSLFPSPALPSFTPTADPLPLPFPVTYDVVRLDHSLPAAALSSSASAVSASRPPLSIVDAATGTPSSVWLLPPQSSLPLSISTTSSSALGIFSHSVPFQLSCPSSSPFAPPLSLEVTAVVTVPTITLELKKDVKPAAADKAKKKSKGSKRWSRKDGWFDYGLLLVGKSRREQPKLSDDAQQPQPPAPAAALSAAEARHAQLLTLTNTSPFEVRLELCMRHDRCSLIADDDAAEQLRTASAAADKKKAATGRQQQQQLTSPKGGKKKSVTSFSPDSEEKEEERRQAQLRPVFSVSPSSLSIPVGGRVDVTVFAFPQSLSAYDDSLLIAIEDNPLPVLLPLHCAAFAPSLAVSEQAVSFPRLLLSSSATAALVISNPHPLPLCCRIDASSLPAFLTLPAAFLSPTVLQPAASVTVPLTLQGQAVGESQHWLTVITEGEDGQEVGSRSTVSIKAEVYQCDAAVELGPTGLLDFGWVRVREDAQDDGGDAAEVERELWVENRGKSELRYALDVPSSSLLSGMLTVTSGAVSGVVAAKAREAVRLRLRASRVLTVQDNRDVSIRLREREDDQPVCFPVPIAFQSAFASYSLTAAASPSAPPSQLEFGCIGLKQKAEQSLRLVNTGRFPISWSLLSQRADHPLHRSAVMERRGREAEEREKEAQKAREAAVTATATDSKKAAGKQDNKKPAAAAAAGKDKKAAAGAAAAAEDKTTARPGTSSPPVSIGAFAFSTGGGVLAVGGEVEVTVTLAAESEGEAVESVQVEVFGVEAKKRKQREEEKRRRREELKRKPWLRSAQQDDSQQAEAKEEQQGEGDVVKLTGRVEAGRLCSDWSAVMAGQGMRDRRRDGGERQEEAEFIVSERLLSFGCIRVSGAATEAEEERKDDGKKAKDKAKQDKEKKPETASAAAAGGDSERKEVRVEEVRLINTSAVEAQVFLSLSATAPPPLTSLFIPPAMPPAAESSAAAASSAGGKKESKAAAAMAAAVAVTATVSPPPPTPVVLGPFSLPFASVVIAAHSVAVVPITLSVPVSSAAAVHTAVFSACVASSTSCLTFAVQAEACKEAVTAAVADIDCGRVQVGEEREEAVLIRNTGLLPVRLRCELSSAAASSPAAVFSCELDGKELVVAATAEERVVVRFVPSSASPAACVLSLRSAFTAVSVPVRGEGCVQAVRVTDGAELQRVEAAGGLAPVLDIGDLLRADGGRTRAFRITNQSTDLLRFVITPPPQPTAADTAPPASAASAKKKAGDRPSLAASSAAAGAALGAEDSKSDFVFAPSVGHLLPGESKLLRVTLRCDAARFYKQARVGLETTRIRREDGDAGKPWDEEMTLLRWLSVDEQQRARQAAQQQREAAEQKAQEAAEAEAAKLKKSGKQQQSIKSPRPVPPAATISSPPPSAPITGPLLTSSPVPEPAFVAVDVGAAAVSVPLFISAVVDRPRLVVRKERVEFSLTPMLDRREEQLEIINASALATDWRWELTADDGAADCFDISPRSGTVAGNGSATVTLVYAPRRDGKHAANAGLLSSSSSFAVCSVALSGSASRPVYVMQLPPAAFPCPPLSSLLPAGVSSDGLRVVCCESVGVNVRTMLRLSVINTSDGDWKFDCSCDDQPDASSDVEEKTGTEQAKTTTLPAITARSATASSKRSLPSPSQPFACHSPTGLIRAGDSRDVLFSFSPSASCPPASAAVCCSRWSFAANGLVTAVALIGRVIEPVVTVSPPSLVLAFEATLLSHSRQQTVSISNPHSFPLSFYTSVLSAAVSASPSVSASSASSLPVSLLPAKGIIGGGETVIITVRYAPRQVGSDECRIVLAFPRKRERVFLRVRGSAYSLVTKVIALGTAETAKDDDTAAEQKAAVKKARASKAAVQLTAEAAGRREESKEQIRGEGALLAKARSRAVSGKRAAAV